MFLLDVVVSLGYRGILGNKLKMREISPLYDAAEEIELSPMIQGVSLSKTIEIHALTKGKWRELVKT